MNEKTRTLPSGYIQSRQLKAPLKLDSDVLPWLQAPLSVAVARCSLVGGDTFLLASAVGAHPKLVTAAEGMTESQKTIADNMFYSRLAGYVQDGYSQNIETMADTVTPFNIKIMRNKGGQRVYFGAPELTGRNYNTFGRVVLRLAVCDKNKQKLVMGVLSTASDARIKRSGR